MAIGIALAAEEHGKIVSARHLCNAVKSYLPTHGTFHKIAHCALCIFANAIRKECAEAKDNCYLWSGIVRGRNPHGVHLAFTDFIRISLVCHFIEKAQASEHKRPLRARIARRGIPRRAFLSRACAQERYRAVPKGLRISDQPCAHWQRHLAARRLPAFAGGLRWRSGR